MSSIMRSSRGVIHADHPWVDAELAWVYDTLSSPYDEDLPWYSDLTTRLHGRVLELACGSGRLLVPIAQAGNEAVGLDVSPDMLELAHQKLACASPSVAERVRLVQGDMRTFALGETFDLAIIAARSFCYLITRADQQRTLAAVAAHLRPGGLLALDLLNPTPTWLLEPPGSLRQDLVHYDSVRDLTIARTETVVSTDFAAQVRMTRSAYEVVANDGSVTKRFVEWPYRYTYRFEAELLLEQAGFEVAGVYGGYQREPFSSWSKWLVMLARRNE